MFREGLTEDVGTELDLEIGSCCRLWQGEERVTFLFRVYLAPVKRESG